VIRFLESLPVTKGHLAGKTMNLLPSQREFINAIYANLDAKGRRVVRLAVQSLPRGNGKSGLLAGLSLAHLLGPEALDRGAVFSAAGEIKSRWGGLMSAICPKQTFAFALQMSASGVKRTSNGSLFCFKL